MFDPDIYRKACSELKLSEQTIEEMIQVTKEKQHAQRRPFRVALVTAALIAALGITASAAGSEAIQSLLVTIRTSFSIQSQSENGTTVFPDVAVEQQGERIVLYLGEVATDITEDLAREGRYVYTEDTESGRNEVTVKADLSWEAVCYDAQGEEVFTFSAPGTAEDSAAAFSYQGTIGDAEGTVSVERGEYPGNPSQPE